MRAQDEHRSFETALRELDEGRKSSLWMWWVFPQLAGLGVSVTSRTYAISSIDEAVAYFADPVLADRLRRATDAVLRHRDLGATAIFGPLDAQKFHSSMTLFHRAAPEEPRFAAALLAFFDGEPDHATDHLLGR